MLTSASLRELFAYSRWPSRQGQNWGESAHGSTYDRIDFHVDLGCGKLPKARIGVDRFGSPGVAVVTDLEAGITYGLPRAPGEDALIDHGDGSYRLYTGGERDHTYQPGCEALSAPIPWGWILPFDDNSIESIVSHHFFEHVGPGFIPLVDDIYRVLKPGGILRAITPLFPSWSSESDPDHKRRFMAGYNDDGEIITTWDSFCGTPDNCWLSSFSTPYTRARFRKLDADFTARLPEPSAWWTPADARELRVALEAVK